MDRPRIVVIGSGNVATHLALAFAGEARVELICSRHASHALDLAALIPDCKATDDFCALPLDADFYIIAVTDDRIAKVSAEMPVVHGIVAHTSGSVPIDALARHQRRGVFYPLQTFSKHSEVQISQVPFLIEASDADTTAKLKALALKLSPTVLDADSGLRSRIHVAAVFACNFPNYLWTCAAELLAGDGLDLTLMRPLLHATLDKALAIGPEAAQTGPARRGDRRVIANHIALLPPALASIYRSLSDNILQKYNP